MRQIFHSPRNTTITGKIYRSTSRLTISILAAYVVVVMVLSSVFFYNDATKAAWQSAEVIKNSFQLFSGELEYKMLNTIVSKDVQKALNAYYQDEQDITTTKISVIDALSKMAGTMTNTSGGDIVLNDGSMIQNSDYWMYLPQTFYQDICTKPYKPFSWCGPYELRHNRYSERKVFVIQKRILDLYDYHQLGMMYLYVDEENIKQVFLDTSHEKVDYVLANEAGDILVGNEKMGDMTSLRELPQSKAGCWRILGHTPRYLIRVPLPIEGVFLVAVIPFNSLLSSLMLVVLTMLIFSGITMGCGVLISKQISRTIAQPISDFAQTMKEATEGNRALRIEKAPADEFEILSDSFNKLMDANDELIANISEKHNNLRYYEYSLFQQQIKPHFLYNALSNISSLVKLDMKAEAVETIENLARFFRLTLSGTNDIITIRNEIEIIDKYFSIQKLRFRDKITLSYHINDDIVAQSIPKLTLQPLIENSIHHAMSLTSRKVAIEVRGFRQDDAVVIEVIDNGEGIPEEKLSAILENINQDNTLNFGLTAVNQRLKLIYGNHYRLRIESVEGEYTKVIIRVPFDEE